MSDQEEDGNVILIAPQTKNQDGSQTFYILDPCPSSEGCNDDPPEIELIDLTAEVKNTGAIAVLSKNSDTGALEITLTNKADSLKLENMDTAEDSNSIRTNGGISVDTKEQTSSIIDDDLENCIVIKDEEEDIDVEEISLNDVNLASSCTDPRSETESVCFEIDENNHHTETEQDDDGEEGVLYIDDAKFSELQEELSYNGREDLKNVVVFESEEKKSIIESAEVCTRSNEVQCENINSPPKEFVDIQEPCYNDKDRNRSSGEALVHGHLIKIPTEVQYNMENCAETEYVDSTNTALTLLELAGGTSYRSNVNTEKVDVVVLEEDGVVVLEKDENVVPPSVQCEIPEEPQSPFEVTTLTTLQAVPVEPPIVVSASSQVIPVNTEPQIKPEPSSPNFKQNIKVSKDVVERLIQGDVPTLGIKPHYKHISNSRVTHDDIAKEILERSMQKCPYSEPSGGDVIFAMKLAHRLATRIVPTDKSPGSEKASGEKYEHLLSGRNPLSNPPLTTKGNTPVSTIGNTPLTTKGNVPVSKTIGNIPLTTKGNASMIMDANQVTFKKSSAISDKIELLKILEDDPDDPSDVDQTQLIFERTKPKKTRNLVSPLIKLHPELEKELALKQLRDVSQPKKKVAFIPEVFKKAPKLEKDMSKKHEHNNNLNSKSESSEINSTKRKISESSVNRSKKLKKEIADYEAAIAHPSQITEKLVVEGQHLAEELSKDGKSLKQYSNKRLSRSSETPPLEVPMEILLNGIEDSEMPQDGKRLSTNKIFKATNPTKRQEELKRKKQKHFANVLQRNKPQKKRGRPPKKKPIAPTDDELTRRFILQHNIEQNKLKVGKNERKNVFREEVVSPPKDEKQMKTKKLTEIERLLGDEGAINMLYSVEQKRATGSEPKRGVLPSYRRKKKDLMLKTKLVKSAVFRLTTSPPLVTGRISLRGQQAKEGEHEETDSEVTLRKMSVDSRDSHQSLSSPQPFPAKIVPAEASRIIRRHSSSSNYSSRSNSPRRLSVDGELPGVISPSINDSEAGQGDAPLSDINKNNKQAKSVKSGGTFIKKVSDRAVKLLKHKTKIPELSQEHFQRPQALAESTTPVKRAAILKSKARLKVSPEKIQNIKNRLKGSTKSLAMREETKKRYELCTSLEDAVHDFTKEIENVDGNIQTKVSNKSSPKPAENGARTSSKKSVYKKSVSSLSSPQVEKPSVVYKELSLKRHDRLVEIILSPVSTKLKNSLNTNVLKELISVLNGLVKDDNCSVVLVTSSGSVFCQGVDFFCLIQPTPEKRMTAALEMAVAIKDFIKTLGMFSKPIVAGVQGPAVGLGTTMLPLFDLVLTSDQASFHTPYARLGQVPEGAATLTLPTLLGSAATSELLFACRKLTAEEAHQFGLVTRILRSDDFHEELVSIATSMAAQSSQSMDATKALLRQNLLTGLETTLVSETHLLVQHWTSQECQTNFNMYLHREDSLSLALLKQPT